MERERGEFLDQLRASWIGLRLEQAKCEERKHGKRKERKKGRKQRKKGGWNQSQFQTENSQEGEKIGETQKRKQEKRIMHCSSGLSWVAGICALLFVTFFMMKCEMNARGKAEAIQAAHKASLAMQAQMAPFGEEMMNRYCDNSDGASFRCIHYLASTLTLPEPPCDPTNRTLFHTFLRGTIHRNM